MNPETDVIINIQTSCTRDEAVAKLLGWSRGRYFPPIVQVTKHGIDKADLGKVARFQGSVQEQLADIYEKARSEFIDAAETGKSHETLSSLEARVIECRALVDRAAEYFLDLDDELASPVTLRIDRMRTERDGDIYITLRSLAEWSKQKYSIDIMKAPGPDDEKRDVEKKDDEKKQVEPEENSAQEESMTDIDKANLALAALMGVVAETNAFKKGEDEANKLAISKKMEAYMKREIPRARGVGHETFRKRLKAAENALAKYRKLQ